METRESLEIGTQAVVTRLKIASASAAVLLGSVASVALIGAAQAASPTPCSQLTSLSLPNTTITAAVDVTGGSFTPPGKTTAITGLPAFCRVTLTVEPAVNIEVWLPEKNWNQRFQAVGNGGYAGSITYSAMAPALIEGYATASTDTGHLSSAGGTFALNSNGKLNEILIKDFAYKSLHQMAVRSKDLIKAYYGMHQSYSYWNGCSTGGRQGLMSAQRYPDDYDGIFAGSPAINQDRFNMAELWPEVVMNIEVGAPIAPAKLNGANTAAIKACDGTGDGIIDGVISDPRQCHFDPAVLQCGTKGAPTDGTCLTPQEAKAISMIWDGPRTVNAKGKPNGPRLFFGWNPGAPIANSIAGATPFSIATQQLAYWILQDPTFDWHTLTYTTFAEDFFKGEVLFDQVIGTDNPDLSNFRAHGGKIVITHGWSDPNIAAMGTIDYFDKVLSDPVNGGKKQVDDFARVFLAPGVAHCGGAAQGPNTFDGFSPVVNWVEDGAAPDKIIASLVQNGQTVETRPLCAYPNVARWKGGNTNDARNFECVKETDNNQLNAENAILPDIGGVQQE